MKKYNIAVIGATGNVGRETVNILADRNFPIDNLFLVASNDSIGKSINFGEEEVYVNSLEDLDFSKIDIAFFCAGSSISSKYIPIATKKGCIVIDKSSFFRLDPFIPLIVPEANIMDLKHYKNKNIISNPNCCTIPLAVALKPLDNLAKISRIVISTYQSVSGAGKAAMDELYNQTKAKYVFNELEPKIFPRQIAFNLIPQIGDFEKDNYTSEEKKIEAELTKIIGTHIKSSVTCVRVPVFVGHSMSVNVEFEKATNVEEIEAILAESDNILVLSSKDEEKYYTPIDSVSYDEVLVSRIRKDYSKENSFNLWIVADNLRKGAALNGVQILEELIKNYL